MALTNPSRLINLQELNYFEGKLNLKYATKTELDNCINVIEDASTLSPSTTYPKRTLIRISGVTLLSNKAAKIPSYIVFDGGSVVLDDDFAVTDLETEDANWDVICGYTIDSIPTQGSTNLVTSNGIYTFVTNSVNGVTPQQLGFGYGACDTAAATAAKTVPITGYQLVDNGYVSVKFVNSVPAEATLNINSKGAKPIYYKGVAITAGIIAAGDTATFVYKSEQYNLVSIDATIDLLARLRGKDVVVDGNL